MGAEKRGKITFESGSQISYPATHVYIATCKVPALPQDHSQQAPAQTTSEKKNKRGVTFQSMGLLSALRALGWVLSVLAEYSPIGLSYTGLGMGANASKSLVWSDFW